MAKPVPTNDSYTAAFQTPLIVGLEQDFNQQGTAAEVIPVGFAPEFVGDPFVERGTTGTVSPVGFSGTLQIGQIFFGTRAEVTPEGKAGSLGNNDGLLTTLPTFEDEQAAYVVMGLDDSAAQESILDGGYTQNQLDTFSGLSSLSDTHDATEADDLWVAYQMYLRLQNAHPAAAAEWLERATGLADFFTNNYIDGSAWLEDAGFNHDHLHARGLALWATEESDSAALATVDTIVSEMVAWNANDHAIAPSDNIGGTAAFGRRWARQLWAAVAAAEASPTTANINWRDRVIDIVLQSTNWDATYNAYWLTDSNATDNRVGSGEFANGARICITFHMGMWMDALWHAWRVLQAEGNSRALSVAQRLIAMATFYRDFPLNVNGFLELDLGYYISGPSEGDPIAVEGEGSPAGVYSLAPINGLVMAYKMTGVTSYLARAQTLYKNWQESLAGAGNLDHYIDSQFTSASLPFLANNKSELQYCYALFENGGNPTRVAGVVPSWYPDWQAPGVIKTIPGGSLADAITANGWTAPTDIVAGGTNWPTCLMENWCGGTVAYVNGLPYLCISGGGHATNPDNVIYALGPLTADAPEWSRLSPQSLDADIVACSDRYLDGRPSSRHTAGDFSYVNGRIVMMWSNSPYCGTGGTGAAIDVYDIREGQWDAAKSPPVSRINDHGLNSATHSASCYHPHDGLIYAKGQSSHTDSFGSYDVENDVFNQIDYSGEGTGFDTSLCTMGPRDFLFAFKTSGFTPVRINTQTGIGEAWATANAPTNTSKCVAYDEIQDRIYTPRTGVSDPGGSSGGSKAVAWFDASAASSPTWQNETFNGDVPTQQEDNGTFGRWSRVPELKGFVLVNSVTSDVYFYRTSE